ncbi:GGDEF domain-containing protein [Herbaspirillum sp. alder98]|uniref:GGDEF domain-containing protein n=1 Tax=Herbaspirillum sp. alder98 TaxID=2913096 RepID=UPI001CD840EC|nr:GGDEF domain-containing protein [Herbaspirillum sp. alder98]MCA1323631.1 GGDEF domain-containing protein [Herbaspirillum sp. alder98]
MDPLTASTSLAIVQLCSSLVMAGVFSSAPSERCTRYWAWSGVLVALGVVVVVAGYLAAPGLWRQGALWLGNTSLFAGSVAAWSGLRHFYQRPAKLWGWFMVALFALLFAWLLSKDVSFTQRAYLAVAAMQLVFTLVFVELMRGLSGPAARHYARWGFGRGMGLAAVLTLSGAYIARLVLAASQPALFEPPHMSPLGVLLIYMIPLGGGMLFSAALLMLYFERLVADKQRLATEDELTGALNRRELVRCGEAVLQQAVAQRQSLTLAFIDVDHFKRINDTFGHLVGDRVLAAIADILKQNCRSGDLLGRYGGEEFCAVFPGLDEGEAAGIGQRLVEAVRQHRFEHGATVTISVGLVVLRPGQLLGWDALVHQADVALYRAKHEGRDAFRLAPAA